MKSTITAFLLCIIVTSVAHGQSDAAREESRARFERGIDHIANSRFAQAIEELEAARSLYPTPSIHFNLGLAYRGVGRMRDATAAFERFLAAVGSTGDPARVQEAHRYLRVLRASLARVRLDITPADAIVSIDGRAIARGTTTVEIDPGVHVIRARARGYREASQELDVQPGTDALAQLELDRIDTATLVLNADPNDAAVRIDGRPRGHGDQELAIAPGMHTLELSAYGRSTSTSFEVAPQERLRLSLSVPRGEDLTWLWAGLGAAVGVGLLIAIVTIIVLNPSVEQPIDPGLGVVMTALGAR